MKLSKSIQPSKLWYVASIGDLETIKEKGIYNYGRNMKLIHKLYLDIFPFNESEKYLATDCLGIKEVKDKSNLQYALIQINAKSVENRLRRCNTDGILISECAVVTDVYHIAPEEIIGYEICTIDLDRLLYLNEWRLSNAMHSEMIHRKDPVFGLKPKEIAHNNRIESEKRSAFWFNTFLFYFVHGDYSSNYYKSKRNKSGELGKVA